MRSRWLVQLGPVPDVRGEGLLVPDRLGRLLGDHRAGIVAPGQRGQMGTLGSTQVPLEALRDGRAAMSPTVVMPRRLESPAGDRADPPQGPHRQRVEEVELAVGRDHHHARRRADPVPVGDGLGRLRRQLGHQLAPADAHRAGRGGARRPPVGGWWRRWPVRRPAAASTRSRRGTPRRGRSPSTSGVTDSKISCSFLLSSMYRWKRPSTKTAWGTAGGPPTRAWPSGRRTSAPRRCRRRPRPELPIRRRSPAARPGTDRRAPPPRRRTHPCRRGGSPAPVRHHGPTGRQVGPDVGARRPGPTAHPPSRSLRNPSA